MLAPLEANEFTQKSLGFKAPLFRATFESKIPNDKAPPFRAGIIRNFFTPKSTVPKQAILQVIIHNQHCTFRAMFKNR